MAGSGNNIQLLLSCQIDKFNSITGNTDSEVCILLFFRMLHSIDQFLFAKYIYVQVMCTLVEISVQYMYQIICTLFITQISAPPAAQWRPDHKVWDWKR